MAAARIHTAAAAARRERERAYRARKGWEAAQRPPFGCAMVDCRPMEVSLEGGSRRVTSEALREHSGGLAVAGMVILASTRTRFELCGSSWPREGYATTWQPAPVFVREGDTLKLYGAGRVLLLPFTKEGRK